MVHLKHQLRQFRRTKFDQLGEIRYDILVTSTYIRMWRLATILQDSIECITLVLYITFTVEEAVQNQTIGVNLAFLILKNARIDQLSYAGIVLLELFPRLWGLEGLPKRF